MTKWD